MPKFSVVIALFNKEGFIANTLKSVLEQTIQDFEIIVVDDGSTDNSFEVVQKIDSSKIKIHQQGNQGASAARNIGMKKASGNYIAFLDADDYWYPDHLEKIETLIDLHPNAKVYATAIEIQDKKGIYPAPYSGISSAKHQLLNFFESSYGAPILSGSSAVVHRSVVDKIGYFDENIISGQDTDYWIRIGMEYTVAFANEITVKYTFVPNSLSQKKFDFKNKFDFSKFEEAAKYHPHLAKYVTYNRFSLWLKCQMANDRKNAEFLKRKINQSHLSPKQRFLLKASGSQLRFLFSIKENLNYFNIRLSAFGK